MRSLQTGWFVLLSTLIVPIAISATFYKTIILEDFETFSEADEESQTLGE